MVDKGYFIYRDPIDNRVQGIYGDFHALTGGFFPTKEKQIVIQPWASFAATMVLIPEIHSEEEAVFQSWINESQMLRNVDVFVAGETEFGRQIEKIKAEIDSGTLEKVVAARASKVVFDWKKSLDAFLIACEKYPESFAYLFFHPTWGLWIGATPELFLYVNGEDAETMALAGTLYNSQDHWTGKEMEEQSVTGKFIEEILLKNHCLFESEPITSIHTGPLQHLLSRYHFHPTHDRVHHLLKDLHPTPAVGGYPQTEATDFIYENEQLDRGLFTGWIGWTEGALLRTFVNLRCAQITEGTAILYAGCGINAGSDPSKEWLETEAKMNVIGSCLNSKSNGDPQAVQ